ncbi:MAG: 2-amino-4-hydroxy-6-hydroxymethyldihydropteridine diphosphokinase [Candidatus Omnitrophica bacterium]|nr:2-amino-4-hydroxy-6-hydroxymethyldihydropteridine diphosphokinase [Candidatus Omnitrophota bacterium]
MVICYLGVGSNLGNRRRNINKAIKELRKIKGIKVLKISSLINTKAQGGPKDQPDFINGALKIKTSFSPSALLKELKIVEKNLGRAKTVRNGPRAIDLDILLYTDRIIKTKRLIIPHPRMFIRDFVVTPLSEVICD